MIVLKNWALLRHVVVSLKKESKVQVGPLAQATIVFDLDGTLVDTAPDLTNALNHVLTARGHAPVTAASVRSSVGFGARAMIEEGLRRAGADDDVDQMLAAFLVHYEANIAAQSLPFPGAVAALEALAAAGAKLAVCTNKREHLTLRLLDALNLQGYFAAIAGRDTFPVAKPDPGHLTGVILRAGGTPANAVMVGDSAVDMATARAAEVKAILVSFGYAVLPLDGPSPDAVIDHFDELAPRAASLLSGTPR
jgi:phosphoglycolate phosphatase